ncbi:MAG: phosphatase PAP2 family protein [Vicinamibacterales bacterium]
MLRLTRPRQVASCLTIALTLTTLTAFGQDVVADTAVLPSEQSQAAKAPTPELSRGPWLQPNALTPPPSIWRDLFGDTLRDVRHAPPKQTFSWLAIGAAAALSTRPADSHVGRSLTNAKGLTETFEAGAVIGSTPLQMGLSATTYAIGRAAGWPRMTAVGADLFRAELLAQGLTIGLKQSVRRHRPEGSGFAFPSGHTTVSFASATVLQQHLGWRVGAPAYGLATYVALSRVQMKRHYLSDVAFGAALGVMAGRTITIGTQRRRLMLSPMATDGGGGVQFTWMGRGGSKP